MNYEEKYKNALERAREQYNKRTPLYDIESIFPELKENEDEEIRKGLIKAFGSIGRKEWGGINVKAAIAWLEKQGEQKLNGTFVNVDDVREDFIDEVYRVLNADSTNDRANQIVDAFDNLPTITIKQDPCEHCQMTQLNCYSFPCDEKREFEQGKTALEAINEEKVDNANKVESKFKVKYAGSEYNVLEVKDIAGVTYYGIEDKPNHIDYVKAENCEIISDYVIKENVSPYPTKPAVFSEQKPTDKVEPKFHEGEWLCENEPNNYARFIQILEIVDIQGKERYRISRDIHNGEDIVEFDFVEKYYHKFDIEDAKAGDVIYSRHNTESFEWMGIFKSLDKENKGVHFYGFWNNVTKTFKVCGNELFVSYDDFSPATKEQRDKLEKAMADAGYEWLDKDRKLVKIVK